MNCLEDDQRFRKENVMGKDLTDDELDEVNGGTQRRRAEELGLAKGIAKASALENAKGGYKAEKLSGKNDKTTVGKGPLMSGGGGTMQC
jgi:hypothetical protein